MATELQERDYNVARPPDQPFQLLGQCNKSAKKLSASKQARPRPRSVVEINTADMMFSSSQQIEAMHEEASTDMDAVTSPHGAGRSGQAFTKDLRSRATRIQAGKSATARLPAALTAAAHDQLAQGSSAPLCTLGAQDAGTLPAACILMPPPSSHTNDHRQMDAGDCERGITLKASTSVLPAAPREVSVSGATHADVEPPGTSGHGSADTHQPLAAHASCLNAPADAPGAASGRTTGMFSTLTPTLSSAISFGLAAVSTGSRLMRLAAARATGTTPSPSPPNHLEASRNNHLLNPQTAGPSEAAPSEASLLTTHELPLPTLSPVSSCILASFALPYQATPVLTAAPTTLPEAATPVLMPRQPLPSQQPQPTARPASNAPADTMRQQPADEHGAASPLAPASIAPPTGTPHYLTRLAKRRMSEAGQVPWLTPPADDPERSVKKLRSARKLLEEPAVTALGPRAMLVFDGASGSGAEGTAAGMDMGLPTIQEADAVAADGQADGGSACHTASHVCDSMDMGLPTIQEADAVAADGKADGGSTCLTASHACDSMDATAVDDRTIQESASGAAAAEGPVGLRSHGSATVLGQSGDTHHGRDGTSTTVAAGGNEPPTFTATIAARAVPASPLAVATASSRSNLRTGNWSAPRGERQRQAHTGSSIMAPKQLSGKLALAAPPASQAAPPPPRARLSLGNCQPPSLHDRPGPSSASKRLCNARSNGAQQPSATSARTTDVAGRNQGSGHHQGVFNRLHSAGKGSISLVAVAEDTATAMEIDPKDDSCPPAACDLPHVGRAHEAAGDRAGVTTATEKAVTTGKKRASKAAAPSSVPQDASAMDSNRKARASRKPQDAGKEHGALSAPIAGGSAAAPVSVLESTETTTDHQAAGPAGASSTAKENRQHNSNVQPRKLSRQGTAITPGGTDRASLAADGVKLVSGRGTAAGHARAAGTASNKPKLDTPSGAAMLACDNTNLPAVQPALEMLARACVEPGTTQIASNAAQPQLPRDEVPAAGASLASRKPTASHVGVEGAANRAPRGSNLLCQQIGTGNEPPATVQQPGAPARRKSMAAKPQQQRLGGDVTAEPTAQARPERPLPDAAAVPHAAPRQMRKPPTHGWLAYTCMPKEFAEVAKAAVQKVPGMRLCVEGHEEGRVTHLVVGSERRTIKMLLAVANGAWVLSPDWVTASMEAGVWLPETDFPAAVRFTATAQMVRELIKAGDSAPGIAQPLQRPLHGHMICVHCAGPGTGELRLADYRKDLERLVRALGGKVVPLRSCSMCVVCKDSRCPKGVPQAAAAVSEDWLLSVAECYQPLPLAAFLVERPEA